MLVLGLILGGLAIIGFAGAFLAPFALDELNKELNKIENN